VTVSEYQKNVNNRSDDIVVKFNRKSNRFFARLKPGSHTKKQQASISTLTSLNLRTKFQFGGPTGLSEWFSSLSAGIFFVPQYQGRLEHKGGSHSMNLKDTIIDETLKLFSLKGYNNTSIQDILAAAGASKGGFYNHFKSKEDLFFQVLEKARKIWRKRNLEGLDNSKSPLESVEQLLRNYKDRYLKDSSSFPGGCIFITLSVELNDQDPSLFSEINKGFIGLKQMILRLLVDAQRNGGLRTGIDPETVTEVLFNGMLGASVCYGAGKSAADLDNTINALVAYLHMIKG